MEDEFTERGELIGTLLDRIKPVPEDAPDEVKEVIDAERQMLAMRAGWDEKPIQELRDMIQGA